MSTTLFLWGWGNRPRSPPSSWPATSCACRAPRRCFSARIAPRRRGRCRVRHPRHLVPEDPPDVVGLEDFWIEHRGNGKCGPYRSYIDRVDGTKTRDCPVCRPRRLHVVRSASDPEVVRRRVTQFFDRVLRSIERYGGTVEKFAGDAVMAAFGIPQAHEDDSERAVRAALEILDGVDQLELQARIGVEAGEVVTGAGDSTSQPGRRSTSPPVSSSSRNRARSCSAPRRTGSRLGGSRSTTSGRFRSAAGEPVWAWAATGAAGRAPARGGHAARRPRPWLDLLADTFARATRDRRAHLVTIYGEPGVGKSRLSNEFLASLEGTTVLHGRCLPYGESITYWPLAEMVKARPTSRTTIRSTSRSRSCASAARPRRSPICSGSRPACSRQSTASAASRRSPGPRAKGSGDGADAAADPRLRGHPLGRGAAARADRAHDLLGRATAR